MHSGQRKKRFFRLTAVPYTLWCCWHRPIERHTIKARMRYGNSVQVGDGCAQRFWI